MSTKTQESLYSKIIASPLKISWSDIFRSSTQKRSQSAVDYAMIAGTTLDTVKTEIGMLQKWQQPWLYLRVLTAGAILSAVMMAAVAVMIFVYGVCHIPALSLLVIVVPPCVVPISLMVFFWEMNAPRDISLSQLIGYFFIGGVLSLTITLLLHTFVPSGNASLAPLTEEPAKLLASLVLLHQLQRKNGKVYGFSGLALGAAVGAGFAAFESVQYAYQQLPTIKLELGEATQYVPVLYLDAATLMPVLDNILLRNICAIACHVVYCAPYACIAALNMKQTGGIGQVFTGVSFFVIFGISFVCHGLWNTIPNIFITLPLFTLVLWSTTLYGIRRSFAQLAEKVSLAGNGGTVTTSLRIQGTRGVHAGVAFLITRQEILIGSESTCQLNYPVSLVDIDKIHSKLLVRDGNLYLADLGSRSGTCLNGSRLKPMIGYLLKSGDSFSLGTSGQEFQVI